MKLQMPSSKHQASRRTVVCGRRWSPSFSLPCLSPNHSFATAPHPGPLPTDVGRGRDSRVAVDGRSFVIGVQWQHSLSPSVGERARVRGGRCSTAWRNRNADTPVRGVVLERNSADRSVRITPRTLKRELQLEAWSLKFLWGLELGAWSFGRPLSPAPAFPTRR